MRYPGRYYKGIVISKILEIMIPLLCEFCYSKDRKYHKATELQKFRHFILLLSYSLILLYNVASEIPSSFAAFASFHIPSVQQQRIFDLLPFKAAHPLFQRHVSL